MKQSQKLELSLKIKKILSKEYPLKDDEFTLVWDSLDPKYLDRMSANELVKTVKFKLIAGDCKSNFAFSMPKYVGSSWKGLPPDQFQLMRQMYERNKERNYGY